MLYVRCSEKEQRAVRKLAKMRSQRIGFVLSQADVVRMLIREAAERELG